jgi:FeoB-associated Cys-rich membrane protein
VILWFPEVIMLWQWIVVGLLIALSAFYVGRQSWRTWFAKSEKGCAGGCGCGSKAQPDAPADKNDLISVDQLTSRLRQRSR